MPWKGSSKVARIGALALALGLPVTFLGDAAWSHSTATASRSAPPPQPRAEAVLGPIFSSASPVPAAFRLASGYGLRRGRSGRRTFHAGADFAAPVGTPVFAARAGRVVAVVPDAARTPGFRGYGNAVLIFHPQDDVWTLYAHLREASVLPGTRVLAGAPVGTVGATSNGRFKRMGAHLHFEVRRRRSDGGPPFPGPYRVNNLDPVRWLAARGVDVHEKPLAVPRER